LSIRWRLTLWNMLALAVVLLGFGALVYGLLAHAHEHIDRGLSERTASALRRVDQALAAELQTLEQDRQLRADPRRRLRYWIAEFLEHEKIFCIVYGPGGRVYLRTPELAEDSVPPLPRVNPGEIQFSEEEVPIIGRQRVLSTRLQVRGKKWTVRLMASLEEVDRERAAVALEREDVDGEFRQLGLVLVASLPAALVVIGGLGYFLARKSLAPVDQIRRSTEEITADRLDRRLPVANPADELGRLAQTINAMIARLERSFAEVRRFTADASHELRTPLTSIRAETEVALGNRLTAEDYQELLRSILEECERLTRLTDQLLTLCREDAGTKRPPGEPVDLGRLVGDVVETIRPLAEAKQLQLGSSRNGLLTIRGDEARLRQVFYNLLDNAIKYTPPGGRITVQLDQGEGAAVVRVCDTGIGIPPDHLPHVFDRFYRVDRSRSREQGGTGLGLSIAQSIVAAHGGTIHLDSAPGQGTTCTVILPEKPDNSNIREERPAP
jgi:heavy metal sensor kinase